MKFMLFAYPNRCKSASNCIPWVEFKVLGIVAKIESKMIYISIHVIFESW